MEVELHDGTVLEFPDGTSKDVIQRTVKARLSAPAPAAPVPAPAAPAPAAPAPAAPAPAAPVAAPPAPFQRAGGGGAVQAGVGDAAIRGAIGVKQANEAAPMVHPITALAQTLSRKLGVSKPYDSTDDQMVLKEQQAEAAADPEKAKRIGGNILGNVMMTALPMSKFAAPAATVKGAAAAGAAVSGGTGMLLNPGEGGTLPEQMESKGKQSGTDALVGGALSGTLRGMGKAVTQMFKPTAETETLMKEGIQPTLAQGADSALGRTIGRITSGVTNVGKRQEAEVIRAYLRRIAPNLDTEGMTVPEINKLLERNFQGDLRSGGSHLGEYGDLLDGKKFMLSPTARQGVYQSVVKKGMQPEAEDMARRAMRGTGSAMQVQTPVVMKSGKLAEYRQLMQDAINDFSKDGVMEKQAKEGLMRARAKFDQLVRDPSLSADELATMKDIDGRYADFLRFADASKSSAAFHKNPSTGGLLDAYRRMDPEGFSRARSPAQREILEPSTRVMGLNSTQNEARTLATQLRRMAVPAAKAAGVGGAIVGGGSPAAIALAPLIGISMAGQTAAGAKALFGGYQAQKDLAQLMRTLPQYGAGAGFALDGNGEN